MEIERKFKINKIPDNLEQFQKKEIEQGYLNTMEPVIRIRRSNDRYLITYKSRLGMTDQPDEVALSCEEVELPLSKEAYEHLKEKVDGLLISKTRYLIPLYEEYIAELDVFHGVLDGLVFVEVEFESEEKAAEFQMPDWFGEDVSFDKRYKNNFLSTVHSYQDLF